VREAFLFVALSATLVFCWRNLWQAYREGGIWYRGDKWDRDKNPFLFWLVVFLSALFGLASPLLLYKIAAGEL
jgi:hypothetical protein